MEYGADLTISNNRKRTVYELCISNEFKNTLDSNASISCRHLRADIAGPIVSLAVTHFINTTIPFLIQGDADAFVRVINDHIEQRYTLRSDRSSSRIPQQSHFVVHLSLISSLNSR
jgi:hypothetical protein